jgi:uncharacterized membrane protein YdjX (TVP38/TMEM64 family)
MATIVLVAVLAWRLTELSSWTSPEHLEGLFAGFAQSNWAPVVVVLVFAIGSLVFFPVTVMITGVAAAFGTWPGLLYALLGSVVAGALTYSIGRLVGPSVLRRFMGPRLSAVQRRIGEQGILTVATVRLVPIAPFTVVNLVAGAIRIPLLDFLIGTVMGLAPGVVVLSALGGRIAAIVAHPTWQAAAMLIGGIVAWVVLSLALQKAITRRRKRSRGA